MTTLPTVSVEGVVETYDASDALGWIRLDGGALIRLGRSACSSDPVVGHRVRVVRAEVGPLGRPRASCVEAAGPRALTRSERIVLIGTLLLGPLVPADEAERLRASVRQLPD